MHQSVRLFIVIKLALANYKKGAEHDARTSSEAPKPFEIYPRDHHDFPIPSFLSQSSQASTKRKFHQTCLPNALQSRCTILPVTGINFSATVPSVVSYNPRYLTLEIPCQVVAILKESGPDTNHLFVVKRARVGSVAFQHDGK
jgi:hypothetical protein